MSEPTEPLPLVRVDNPFPLLDKMIEKGSTPEALGKMMDLAERWKAMQALEAFAVAMNECQREMPSVVRDKINKETNKGYAPIETVQASAKPVYSKHGFSVAFDTAPEVGDPSLLCVHCDVTHRGGHTKRHFLHNVGVDDTGPKGNKNKTPIQGQMSSMSYAMGRLLRMAFNITVADEDKDGSGNSDDPPLTDKQIETINELICDLKDAGGSYDAERFAAFMLALEKGESRGDRTFGDAPQSMYGPGVENLLFKIKNARAKAGAK